MKKVATPRSPKKEDALKISSQFLNEVELNTKNLTFDLKNWNDILAILTLNIEKIEKVVQKSFAMPSQDLAKEFGDTETKLTKVKKEMEAAQKNFNKLQADFEKKIVTPLAKGDFNGLAQSVLNEIRENLRKTNEAIAANFKALNLVIEKSIEYTRKLVILEPKINQICLPDEMEKAVDLNEKLMKRLTLLCEVTSAVALTPPPAPAPAVECDVNIQKSFLSLYQEHQKAGELLKRIQGNIKVPDSKLKG